MYVCIRMCIYIYIYIYIYRVWFKHWESPFYSGGLPIWHLGDVVMVAASGIN